MADKLAAAYQFALVVTLTQTFIIGFLSKYICSMADAFYLIFADV